jgi:hypothetical protein
MTYQPPQPPYADQPASGQPFTAPPPQYGYPPVQAPKKRRKWPWIVGGLVLAIIVGCVGLSLAGVFGAAKAVNNLDDNQKGKNAAAGVMNTAARDGKFEFTVTGMKCGVPSVGDDVLGQKAQGQFCLVAVDVKNAGGSAEIFDDSSQKGYDAAGAEYSVDSGAGVYANKDYSTFLEQINPGNVVKGQLVFDIPKGAKLASVVLHESTFTAGVKVSLQ